MRKQLSMTEVSDSLIYQQQAPLNLVLKTFNSNNSTAPPVDTVVTRKTTEINVRTSSSGYLTQTKRAL